MRAILLIVTLLLSQTTFSQQNVRELKKRINKLSTNTKIEIKSNNSKQEANSKTVSPSMIQSEKLELNKAELITLKYSETIKPSNENESNNIIANLEKFRLENIDNENQDIKSVIGKKSFRIIPEYYIEKIINNNNEKVDLIYRPVFTTLKSLKYTKVGDDYGYKSTLSFILFCENDNNGQKIKSPVLIEINSKSASLYPSTLSINHLNLPSTDIEIFTKNATDSVDVKIITNNNPDGYIDHIKVIPKLQLSSSRTVIQGYGIQKIPINIRFKGSSSNNKEQVSIITNKGSIDSLTFELAFNSQKNIFIRSEGIDDIEVYAITSSVNNNEIGDSNKIVIKQEFPWKFIMFAILGGLIGGVVRYGKSTTKFFIKMVLISTLMGIIGALTYFVLQVNLLDIQILSNYNEFGVLAYSALISLLLPLNKNKLSDE